MAADKLLDIKNINVYRGSTQVFSGFSLEVEHGCNTAILGPNGSGKTTFLKLFSRELHPAADNEGSIKTYGHELWNVWELRKRFGIVSHDLQQRYLARTKGREVILSGYYSSVGTSVRQDFSDDQMRRAEQIMLQLEISCLADRPFGTLSTGEQRRFLLGRALIHDPEVLLLDEPTAGLDLKAAAGYFAALNHLMQQGKTVLLVTHHIHEILPAIDRVVLLKAGQVIADGLKSEILNSKWLSTLFDMRVEVYESRGYYYAVPVVAAGPAVVKGPAAPKNLTVPAGPATLSGDEVRKSTRSGFLPPSD